MLSDEEKEALRNFKSEYETCDHYSSDLIIELDDAEIILNLIEKQSKEIEELKEYKHDAELTKVACCTAQNCEALNNCIKLERELQNADKKWEDKIKAKIEEVDKDENASIPDIIEYAKEYATQKLQSLLEKE